MAGDAREKNAPDHLGYAEWSSKIVRDELHKAGWRLADLLQQALTSTSTTSAVPDSSRGELGRKKNAFAVKRTRFSSNKLCADD